MLDKLSAREDVDQSRLASVEWRLLPAVRRHDRNPKTLHRLLASDPSFFVDVVSLVYRGEGEEARELDADESTCAERGWHLLNSWRSVPGRTTGGVVEEAALRSWMRQAREQLAAVGRGVVGDQIIGQVLSGSSRDEDGSFPCVPVRNVIEDVESEELERGFLIGVLNSRGVVTRSSTAGGAAERQLAEEYEGLATAVTDRWPRTASMLRRIAASYRAEATHEDLGTAISEDLDL